MAEGPDNKGTAATANSNHAFLVRVQGAEFGPVYALDPNKGFGLGRASDNAVVVVDEECSRYHAKLMPESAGWRIQDLGSTNGTRVNDRKIDRPVALRAGDRVSLGTFNFVFATDLSSLPVESKGPEMQVGGGLFIQQRRKRAPSRASLDPTTAKAGDWDRADIPKPAIKRLARAVLALGMAADPAAFADAVLFALLEGTNADSAAFVEGAVAKTLRTVAERSFAAGSYFQAPDEAITAVITTKEAILAEDIVGRKQTSALRRSMVLAPVVIDDRVIGLIHLYTINASLPMNGDDLDLVLALADHFGPAFLERRRQQVLALEGESLRDHLRLESEMVGTSSALAQVVKKIAIYAANDNPVLVFGESGTGKDLAARSIHQSGSTKDGPYLAIHCGAGKDDHMESELFGHEKGAFSSAYEAARGKAEMARGGTLVIDEIALLSTSLQTKLLRALDGHGFERMGGAQPIPCGFRLIATSSRNLTQLVAEGKFRGDLHDRLVAQTLPLPTLRDRPQDVPLLAQHFLKRFSSDIGKKVETFSPGALLRMGKHTWPHNVRELKNAIERAVLVAKGTSIETDDLILGGKAGSQSPNVAIYRPLPLDQVAADHVLRTLRFTGWNLNKSAEILSLDRSTLELTIEKYHLKQEGT